MIFESLGGFPRQRSAACALSLRNIAPLESVVCHPFLRDSNRSFGWLAVSIISVAELSFRPCLAKTALRDTVAGLDSSGCSSTWYSKGSNNRCIGDG